MKINFGRRTIETVCTFLAYYLLLFVLFLFVFYQADRVFEWDIISRTVQRVIETFLIPSLAGIIVFCIIISVLINFSLISINLEKMAGNAEAGQDPVNEISIGSKTKKTLLLALVTVILFIGGFQLFDMWRTSKKIDEFKTGFASKEHLGRFDSLMTAMNRKDTLIFRPIKNSNGEVIGRELRADSCFGLSNINICRAMMSSINGLQKSFGKQKNVDMQVITRFNNRWIETNSYNSYYREDLNALSKYEMINYCFGDDVDKVKTIEHEGYRIHYVAYVKSFRFVVELQSDTESMINCHYTYW